MRLANGIVLDKEKTFGVLKFSALRHEVRVENEDGTTTEIYTLSLHDALPILTWHRLLVTWSLQEKMTWSNSVSMVALFP